MTQNNIYCAQNFSSYHRISLMACFILCHWIDSWWSFIQRILFFCFFYFNVGVNRLIRLHPFKHYLTWQSPWKIASNCGPHAVALHFHAIIMYSFKRLNFAFFVGEADMLFCFFNPHKTK